MAKIKQIMSREILNSRGIPTLETIVVLQNGISATADVPSGVSTGSYEALEIRDKDPMRFKGMGVLHAVNSVETLIGPKLIGMEVTKQQEIDKAMIELDGTQNKAKLGANSILSISMAVAKAGATSSVLPLFLYLRNFLSNKVTQLTIPTPLMNMMEGGKHATETTDFQEFLLIPASSKSYSEALQIGFDITSSIKDLLRMNNFSTLVGDEGGFSPKVATNYDIFSLFSQAIESTNYRLGFDVFLGLDSAANTFYNSQQYRIRDKQMLLSSSVLSDYYEELTKQFNIIYLEDPLAEDDWDGWTALTQKLGQSVTIAGDDLTTTNPYRLQTAIEKKSITGIVIKPNQIGTVIESLAVAEIARASGLKVIAAHRGGETTDSFIADFAVAIGADYCKFGALQRGERVAKYNRLLQIEKQLQALK